MSQDYPLNNKELKQNAFMVDVYITSVSEESITNQLPDIPDDLIKSTAGAVRTLGRVFKKKVRIEKRLFMFLTIRTEYTPK